MGIFHLFWCYTFCTNLKEMIFQRCLCFSFTLLEYVVLQYTIMNLDMCSPHRRLSRCHKVKWFLNIPQGLFSFSSISPCLSLPLPGRGGKAQWTTADLVYFYPLPALALFDDTWRPVRQWLTPSVNPHLPDWQLSINVWAAVWPEGTIMDSLCWCVCLCRVCSSFWNVSAVTFFFSPPSLNRNFSKNRTHKPLCY